MTNTQLYLAIGVPLIVNSGLTIGLYIVLTKYMDARFTAIDNSLKFLLDHVVDHGERIASLETFTKINKP